MERYALKYPNNYFKNKVCPTCAVEYTPTAPSQSYCSRQCRGKNAYYTRVYGITEAQYEDMKRLQNNKCMICSSEGFMIGKNGHTEKLVVDHDHETGQVRSLLCHNCNRALGLLKDNVDTVQAAANYLNLWKRVT